MKLPHCPHCGAAFVDAAWPRHCAACAATTYRNPTPVAVLLLPIATSGADGVLVIRRGLKDGFGKLALPGGYVDFGETWQQAAVRELREETQVVVDANDVALFGVDSADNGTLLVFARGPRLQASSLPVFAPSAEITARDVVTAPTELAFPLHTQALARFFRER